MLSLEVPEGRWENDGRVFCSAPRRLDSPVFSSCELSITSIGAGLLVTVRTSLPREPVTITVSRAASLSAATASGVSR